MSKEKPSKLDPFAETLQALEVEGKTLADMVAWLKQEGITAAPSTISDYLASLRDARSRSQLLQRITTGSRQCKEVEAELAKNPAPELETLVKLHRVLILHLSTQGNADPEMLKLADQMTNTVLNCISARTKAAHKEREVALAEQKHAETKKDEQQKALEFCLSEAKAWPAVQDLFKKAFAALKNQITAGGSPTGTGGSPVPPTQTTK